MKYQLGSNETFELVWPNGKVVRINNDEAVASEGETAIFATRKWVEDVQSYTPIAISSFSVTNISGTNSSGGDPWTSTNLTPRGSVKLSSATFSYRLSKKASSVSLKTSNTGTVLKTWTNVAASTTTTVTIALADSLTGTSTKNWYLEATETSDGLPAGQSAHKATSTSASISRQNYVYYGTAASQTSITASFVSGLATKTLVSAVVAQPVWVADPGKYFWYAIPARLRGTKAISFRVGSATTLPGGVSLVGTLNVPNQYQASGDSSIESYEVYRSDNSGGIATYTVYVSVA